ncbi:hypothetical protein J7F01_33775 [Streptomyces sp. ISL-22]|nr:MULTISPECIES: hypothetical protein [Streptomyces]MBT2421283.1 hypothetical protein [Streptomyces sp. ISL-24]MBT2437042.1 hypothetical protein [Streptomyces sp. ISL-22]
MKRKSPQLPLHETGVPVPLETSGIPAPAFKRAFDQLETRDAWERMHRKVRRRRTIWWVLCLPSFLAVSALMSPDAGETANKIGGPTLIAWVIGYPALLYLSHKSLSCVRRMRRVLETHPWRLVPRVRRTKGTWEAYTAAVQLQYDEHERLTGLMSVWNPVRTYRRWPKAMEYGAWYAGDTFNARTAASKGRGVLTLPGVGDLFSVTQRPGDH